MPFTHNALLTWSTSSSGTTFTSSGDISNANLYSKPFRLENFTGYSAQIVYTGGAVTGAFKLQGSNDQEDSQNDAWLPTNWTDIDTSSTTVAAAGSTIWNATNVFYRWVRVVWTEGAASTGAVTGRIQGQGAR
jgi:hypothetical protein